MTPEEKIADLKANFDYVLEGKDVEIMELKETLAQTIENDEVAYETLKLHDQEEIGMLKSRVTELENKIADIKANCDLAIEGRDLKIKELEQQIEKMKCCQNCDHYRWSNGDDWCNDHYGQPMYDEECKGKWKLRR